MGTRGAEAMSLSDDEMLSNESRNPTLQDVVSARLSRRGLIVGAAAVAGVGSLLSAIPGRSVRND
jgi:secreted PhoX family phosphatase